MDVSFESTESAACGAHRQRPYHLLHRAEFRSKYEATTQASTWLADQLGVEDQVQGPRTPASPTNAKKTRFGHSTTSRTLPLSGFGHQQAVDRRAKRPHAQGIALPVCQSGNLDAVPEVQGNSVLADLMRKRADPPRNMPIKLANTARTFPRCSASRPSSKTWTMPSKKKNRKYWISSRAISRRPQQRETLLTKVSRSTKAETNQMGGKACGIQHPQARSRGQQGSLRRPHDQN